VFRFYSFDVKERLGSDYKIDSESALGKLGDGVKKQEIT